MTTNPHSDPATLSPDQIVGLIDHALLHPTLSDAQFRAELVALHRLKLASVCVKPHAVPVAVAYLAGTGVAVGTVIGFPHGSPVPAIKAAEARQAFADGARDVDMVVNVGKVLSCDWPFVREDIRAVRDVAREQGGVIKVIFETDYLPSDGMKIHLCEICSELAVDFVKTSTGFGFVKQPDGTLASRGATDHDVSLMRRHCPATVGVKASGGIRSLEDLLRMLRLGATRIGTSSTLGIYRSAVERAGGTAEPSVQSAATHSTGY
jgi:deoxyribose-phosphate aldolase